MKIHFAYNEEDYTQLDKGLLQLITFIHEGSQRKYTYMKLRQENYRN